MGAEVFAFCPKLTTVKFGAGATTTGTYTFTTRRYVLVNGELVLDESVESSLTTVELSGTIEGSNGLQGKVAIGEGTFEYCTKLTSIDLNGAISIGDDAFYSCTALQTVTGIEKVKHIGSAAFAGCTSLQNVNLSAAQSLYYRAFFGANGLKSVTFGDKLEGIGDESFAETALSQITIPASVTYVGRSAFSGVTGLRSFTVAAESSYYFAEDGVLYRYIDKAKGVYELCAYPLGKMAPAVENEATYTVKEGTVNIKAFAFYGVSGSSVTKVILPSTLKTVGNGAFFNCGITVFQFESVAAPALLEDVSVRVIPVSNYSHNSFFYNNFVDYLAYVSPWFPGDTGENATTTSNLTLISPTNGTGYDSYIYQRYFGTKTASTEKPEDNTNRLIQLIGELYDAQTVSGWNSSNMSKEDVQAFAAKVTEAHALYNGLTSQTQIGFVGQDGIDKLFAVEEALRPVKASFGIAAKVSGIVVSPQSAHKTQYNAGEKFSLSGLKVLVTYDDYYQETVDAAGNFTLRYDAPLTAFDSVVTLDGKGAYAGRAVRVNITVKEIQGGNVTDNGDGSGNAPVIISIVVGVVALIAVAAVVTVLVLRQKGIILAGKKGGKADFEEYETDEAKVEPNLDEEATAEAENTENTAENPDEEDIKGEKGTTDD